MEKRLGYGAWLPANRDLALHESSDSRDLFAPAHGLTKRVEKHPATDLYGAVNEERRGLHALPVALGRWVPGNSLLFIELGWHEETGKPHLFHGPLHAWSHRLIRPALTESGA